MNDYETIFIVKPEATESRLKEIQDKLESLIKTGEGQVLRWNDWGTKRLAYPMRGNSKGHYIHSHYQARPGIVKDVETHLKHTEDILKYMSVRIETSSSPKTGGA